MYVLRKETLPILAVPQNLNESLMAAIANAVEKAEDE
jgi:hypothetical protein